jgi:hypothetical protein
MSAAPCSETTTSQNRIEALYRTLFYAVFYAFVPYANGVGVATRRVSLELQLTSRNDLVGKAVASDCDLQGENCVPAVEFENTGKRIMPQ